MGSEHREDTLNMNRLNLRLFMTCWHFCLGAGLGAVLHYLNELFLYIFHKSK